MMPPRKALVLLALVGSLTVPTAAQTPSREALPPPTGALLADWVRDALVSDSGRHVPDTAEQLYERANLRADTAIARETTNRVLSRLGRDLTGAMISCSGGVVTLRGQVQTAEQRDIAGDATRAVHGVKALNNLLLTPGETPSETPTLIQAAPDGPGHTELFRFLTDDQLAGRGMLVEADRGVVTIHGEVNSSAARRHVVETTRGLPGVRVVRNLTTLQALDRDHDLRLSVLVHRRLEHQPDLQPVVAHIEVIATNGVILLEGCVRTEYQRSLAAAVAADLRLVFAVDEHLEVVPDLKPRSGADWPPRHRNTTHEGTTLLKFGK